MLSDPQGKLYLVWPQAQATVEDKGQGRQGPLWHGAGHLWLPQGSLRPHGRSHGEQSPSQQRRLHWCLPQAFVSLQRSSHLHTATYAEQQSCIAPKLLDLHCDTSKVHGDTGKLHGAAQMRVLLMT